MTRDDRQSTSGGIALSRRRYVASAAAVAGVALAGCSDVLGGGGGGGGDPTATIQSFVDAANNGNVDEANGYIHPDAETSATQEQVDQFQQVDVSIDSMEVVEEGDERATVDVTAMISAQGESMSSTSTWELRTNQGEWMIWSTGS